MDRICIKMPDDIQSFLYALPVIQDVQTRLAIEVYEKRPERDPFYEVTIRVNDKFQHFEPCFHLLKNNKPIVDYTGWSEQERGDYSNFIDFSPEMFERAKAIARPTKRHITDGLGLLIGAGPAPKTPILSALQIALTDKGILIDERLLTTDKLIDLINANYSSADILVCTEGTALTSVYEYGMVIGQYSPYTYVATALKRCVLEVFPDNDSRYLYGNVDSDKYRALAANPSDELVFTVFEEMYKETKAHVVS